MSTKSLWLCKTIGVRGLTHTTRISFECSIEIHLGPSKHQVYTHDYSRSDVKIFRINNGNTLSSLMLLLPILGSPYLRFALWVILPVEKCNCSPGQWEEVTSTDAASARLPREKIQWDPHWPCVKWLNQYILQLRQSIRGSYHLNSIWLCNPTLPNSK